MSLQGAVEEHIEALQKYGAEAIPIKKAEGFKGLDGLVIPGGESTTIGKLINRFQLAEPIRELFARGKPILGTCAGLIFLAAELENEEPHLGLLSVKVRRNAFGRRRESFETNIDIAALGSEPFPAVFIRAPYISAVSEGIHILAAYEGKVAAVRLMKGRLLPYAREI